MPLKLCLENTLFRATDEGFPRLEYFLIGGLLPRAPSKEGCYGRWVWLEI